MTQLRRLDRYLLGDRLGSGGMGNVYCAAQTGPLGFIRAVAVKELHPHLARDADFVSMLLNEARIQGALDHPNVVPVLDAVALSGELYLVLPLVQGVALSELIRRARESSRKVPEGVAVAIACDLLEGLHAAHELRDAKGQPSGVVHRDVSPQNVLIAADGVARLLDFGIAKAESGASTTRAGQLKGKPIYMSPEQLDGEPLDRRSDVYSAGLVVTELLTLERPCPKSEPNDVRAWAEQVLQEPVSWLRSLGLHEELATAVGPWLALQPAHRTGSAREAARRLAAVAQRASAAEVGGWAVEIAGDLIAERREMVERVLSGASSQLATQPTQPTRSDVAPAGARPSTPSAAPLSSRSAKTASRVRARLGQAAVLALLLGAGFVCGRSGSTATAPSSAAAAAPPSAGPTLAPRAPSPEPEASLGAQGSDAGATNGALALASAPAVRPSIVARKLSAPPAASVSAPAVERSGVACDPPYRIDEHGVRIFKTECL